jgi:hypothetical protein
MAVRVVMDVASQSHLFELVRALGPPRGLAGRLHGREEQGDQGADDGDHDQELDERETSSA